MDLDWICKKRRFKISRLIVIIRIFFCRFILLQTWKAFHAAGCLAELLYRRETQGLQLNGADWNAITILSVV